MKIKLIRTKTPTVGSATINSAGTNGRRGPTAGTIAPAAAIGSAASPSEPDKKTKDILLPVGLRGDPCGKIGWTIGANTMASSCLSPHCAEIVDFAAENYISL